MVRIVVEYLSGQTRYFSAEPGWRICTTTRCLIVGTGLPRTHIPLDVVSAFTVQDYRPEQAPAHLRARWVTVPTPAVMVPPYDVSKEE